MSSIINKVKDAVHPDKHHSQPEGTAGPHGSRVANAADPRVDSDRDHRGNPASSVGTGHSASAYGPTDTTGSYGTTGPHSSNVGNKLDPRIDSDRDHRANPASSAGTGLTGTHGTTGAYGTTGSSGLTGTHGSSGLTGTHGSSHMTGYNDPEGTHGPHSSRVANAADPRVDSDRDHRGVGNTYGGGTTGTSGLGGSGPGPAANTAGPHKSDMMNKADPRVDSDLDGSRTVGQDKTFRS